jgi:hypothetical protein
LDTYIRDVGELFERGHIVAARIANDRATAIASELDPR